VPHPTTVRIRPYRQTPDAPPAGQAGKPRPPARPTPCRSARAGPPTPARRRYALPSLTISPVDCPGATKPAPQRPALACCHLQRRGLPGPAATPPAGPTPQNPALLLLCCPCLLHRFVPGLIRLRRAPAVVHSLPALARSILPRFLLRLSWFCLSLLLYIWLSRAGRVRHALPVVRADKKNLSRAPRASARWR